MFSTRFTFFIQRVCGVLCGRLVLPYATEKTTPWLVVRALDTIVAVAFPGHGWPTSPQGGSERPKLQERCACVWHIQHVGPCIRALPGCQLHSLHSRASGLWRISARNQQHDMPLEICGMQRRTCHQSLAG
jgi:hypothetical protein